MFIVIYTFRRVGYGRTMDEFIPSGNQTWQLKILITLPILDTLQKMTNSLLVRRRYSH